MRKLKRKLEELKNICTKLENEFKQNESCDKREILIKKYNNATKNYYTFLNEYEELKNIQFAKNNKSDINDNEIDLYLKHLKKETGGRLYLIFLHDTYTHIGEIQFFGKENKLGGNISYEIKKAFQGHKYALKALNLMTDKIYEDGIDKFYISAFNDNIASIKTIEKFGGTLTNNISNVKNYECDLNIIKKGHHK